VYLHLMQLSMTTKVMLPRASEDGALIERGP
jgi:hypothetical protein